MIPRSTPPIKPAAPADPRAAELQALAAETGTRLPLPTPLILWLEDKGLVVDLANGRATRPTAVGRPTPSGTAVAHLLRNHAGDLA